jgi:SAM-dependent methyltransferase
MHFWVCVRRNVLFTRNPVADVSLQNLFGSKEFFSSDNPGGDDIDYFDFIGGEKFLRKTARNRIGQIKRFKPSGRLLEVASAAGFFLIEAKKAGYDTTGVEISLPMARYAFERWGIPVIGESIERIELQPLSYDVIASWGVMTILRDPPSVIRKFYRALKPGGVWAFNTYYHDSVWHKIFRDRWSILNLQSSQVFSKQLLLDVVSREGFTLLSRRRDWPHTDILKIADFLAAQTGWLWLVKAVQMTGTKHVIVRVPLPDVFEYVWHKPGIISEEEIHRPRRPASTKPKWEWLRFKAADRPAHGTANHRPSRPGLR